MRLARTYESSRLMDALHGWRPYRTRWSHLLEAPRADRDRWRARRLAAHVELAVDASLARLTTRTVVSLWPEMDKHSPEVVGILLHTVVQCLDLLLVEEAQHALFQLAAPFPGDDLDCPDLLLYRFVDDGSKCTIDVFASIVDLM